MTEPLPELVDCRGVMAETGLKRATAEAIMRRLPVVQFEGIRKVYVRKDDLQRYIDGRTSTGEWRFHKEDVRVS